MASNLPPIIQARIAFLERARDQFIEKRNNIVILRDIENLYQSEVNFFALLCRNIEACETDYREIVGRMFAEVEEVKRDHIYIATWRRHYRQIREQRIDEINAIESRWRPIWSFKINKLSLFVDDIKFELSHRNIDDLVTYRLHQFMTYWSQLIQQFCLNDLPTDCIPSSPGVPQGITRPRLISILDGKIETRLPSQDYIFIPGKSYDHEYQRYMRMYIEESINLGPGNVGSDEFIPYTPLSQASLPQAPRPLGARANNRQ